MVCVVLYMIVKKTEDKTKINNEKIMIRCNSIDISTCEFTLKGRRKCRAIVNVCLVIKNVRHR